MPEYGLSSSDDDLSMLNAIKFTESIQITTIAIAATKTMTATTLRKKSGSRLSLGLLFVRLTLIFNEIILS